MTHENRHAYRVIVTEPYSEHSGYHHGAPTSWTPDVTTAASGGGRRAIVRVTNEPQE